MIFWIFVSLYERKNGIRGHVKSLKEFGYVKYI